MNRRSRHHVDPADQYYDLDNSQELPVRMAQLITSSLNPMATSQGKKLFAHYYVKRGLKKVRATLGELSLAEYIFGFMCLINSPQTYHHDKPFMFTHLSNMKTLQAMSGCGLGPGQKRCAFSLLTEPSRGTTSIKLTSSACCQRTSSCQQLPVMSPQNTPMRPLLKCQPRLGLPGPAPHACPFHDHHVQNGYRHLHICQHCIFQKCAPFHIRETNIS